MRQSTTAAAALIVAAVILGNGGRGAPAKCAYQVPHVDEVITGVQLQPADEHGRRVKRAEFGALRIKLHFDESVEK